MENHVAGLITEREKGDEDLSRKRWNFQAKVTCERRPLPAVMDSQQCPCCAKSQLGVAQGKYGLRRNMVVDLGGAF